MRCLNSPPLLALGGGTGGGTCGRWHEAWTAYYHFGDKMLCDNYGAKNDMSLCGAYVYAGDRSIATMKSTPGEVLYSPEDHNVLTVAQFDEYSTLRKLKCMSHLTDKQLQAVVTLIESHAEGAELIIEQMMENDSDTYDDSEGQNENEQATNAKQNQQ